MDPRACLERGSRRRGWLVVGVCVARRLSMRILSGMLGIDREFEEKDPRYVAWRHKLAAVARIKLSPKRPIIAVTPMTTGFSNDTYLIEGPDLILRLPPAAGAMLDGHDVIGQARIYAALGHARCAAGAAHRAVDESADLLGAPFFIMDRIAGESVNDIEMQPWFTDA